MAETDKNTNPLVPPATTEKCLIFPLDSDKTHYDTHFYIPELTDGRLGVQEFNEMINEIQEFMKTRSDRHNILAKIVMSFLFFGACVLTAFGAYINVMTSGEAKIWILYAAGWLIFMCVGCVGCGRCCLYRNNQRVKEEVSNFVLRFNTRLLGRGLRWNVPENYLRWIELWKDSVDTEINQNANGQANPPNYGPAGTELNTIFILKEEKESSFQISLSNYFEQSEGTEGLPHNEEIIKCLRELEPAVNKNHRNLFIAACLMLLFALGLFILVFKVQEHMLKDISFPVIFTFIVAIVYSVLLYATWLAYYSYAGFLDRRMRVECTQIVNKHNDNMRNWGLRWHIPPNFDFYIEVWKEYKYMNRNGERLIYL